MDSNKDEGMRCMAIGKAAMEAGDRNRAVKFLTKAQRLYPNPQVDAYLSALYERNGKQAADEKPSVVRSDSVDGKSGGDAGNAGIRHRNNLNHSGSSAAVTSSSGRLDATAEQIQIVARIKRTKDYYEILSVTKDCSEEDVRKAYRKISLKVHPDKNKAAGAEEAFKSVSSAFLTLSDVELREKYDRYGPEEEQQQQSHIRRRGTTGNPGVYEDIFEANDVFNSFFFGMQQQQGRAFRGAHFTRPAGGGGRQENHSNNVLGLLQLIPIIALVLFTFFPFSQPVYILENIPPYHYMYRTQNNAVNFYVKTAEFNVEYPLGSHSRRQVEAEVERDYRDILIHHCRVEQGYQRWGQKRETPHCDRLQRFVRVS